MLAVFVQGRGTDAVQFTPRQGRLQKVGGIHGALRLPGADQGVHFVDEQDDLPGRRRDLGQDCLQAFFELAAELGPCDQRPQVEDHQAFLFQVFRHVAVDDAQRQALDDGGLAHAGFADQHRVVLGPTRQHLYGAADFLVAADHRVELTVHGRLGQVAGIFLERVIGILGIGRVGGAALAEFLDRRVQVLRLDARFLQDVGRLGALGHDHGEQQHLDRDEAIAGLVGDLLRLVEQLGRFRRQVDLHRVAFDLGQALQLALGQAERALSVAARGFDQRGRKAFLVVEQHLEKMQRRELLVGFTYGKRLRALNEAARAFGKFLKFHLSRPLATERCVPDNRRTGRPSQGLVHIPCKHRRLRRQCAGQ